MNKRLWLKWPVLLPLVATVILWGLGRLFPAAGCSPDGPHHWISAVSGGIALYLFLHCLKAFAPGTHVRARGVYAAMALAGAPAFVRAGMSCEPYLLRLALILLLLLAVAHRFDRRRAWHWLWIALAAAGALLYAYSGYEWSAVRLWQAGFGAAGQVCGFNWPTLVCALVYPLMHPAFCLLLPGLFLLFKKTDIRLPVRRLLLFALAIYIIWVSGGAAPVMADLLPAYAIWLLVLFPAWDRFFAYGFYFFPRLAGGLLWLLGILQLVFLLTGWGATLPK